MSKKNKKIYRPFDDDDEDDEDSGFPFGGFPFGGNPEDLFKGLGGNPEDFFKGLGGPGGIDINKVFKDIMRQLGGDDFKNFYSNLMRQMTGAEVEDGDANEEEPTAGKHRAGPFVYGFSVRIGPDGKPVIDKFGNIAGPPAPITEDVVEGMAPSDVREPMSDVIDDEEEIIVVAELPGVQKEDIHLNATDFSLEIIAESETHRYRKQLSMPGRIKPDVAKARYNNGILEVRLQKIQGGAPSRIKVE